MSERLNVERIAPSADGFGFVLCRVCGLQWVTTPEQDELLADLFEHDATHDVHPAGGELRYLGRLGEHDAEA